MRSGTTLAEMEVYVTPPPIADTALPKHHATGVATGVETAIAAAFMGADAS